MVSNYASRSTHVVKKLAFNLSNPDKNLSLSFEEKEISLESIDQ